MLLTENQLQSSGGGWWCPGYSTNPSGNSRQPLPSSTAGIPRHSLGRLGQSTPLCWGGGRKWGPWQQKLCGTISLLSSHLHLAPASQGAGNWHRMFGHMEELNLLVGFAGRSDPQEISLDIGLALEGLKFQSLILIPNPDSRSSPASTRHPQCSFLHHLSGLATERKGCHSQSPALTPSSAPRCPWGTTPPSFGGPGDVMRHIRE